RLVIFVASVRPGIRPPRSLTSSTTRSTRVWSIRRLGQGFPTWGPLCLWVLLLTSASSSWVKPKIGGNWSAQPISSLSEAASTGRHSITPVRRNVGSWHCTAISTQARDVRSGPQNDHLQSRLEHCLDYDCP